MTEIFLLNHNYYTDPLVRSISQWLPYLRHDLGMVASAQLVFFLPCQKKLAAADRSGNFIVRSIRRIQRASTHRLVIAAWVTVVVLSYDGCLLWSLFNYYAHQHRYDHAYKRCKKSASLMTPYQRRGYIRNVSPVSFIYQIHNKNNLQEFWGRPPADPSETPMYGTSGLHSNWLVNNSHEHHISSNDEKYVTARPLSPIKKGRYFEGWRWQKNDP